MFGYTLYRLTSPARDLKERYRKLPDEYATPENKSKLGAFCVAVETNRFENDYRVFENVVLALNELTVDPDELHPPKIPEIAWALYEVSLEKPAFAFSLEVKKYVWTIQKEEGYVVLPPELEPFRREEGTFLEKEIKKRLPSVLRAEEPEFQETTVDIQLARLWACRQYVKERASQLEAELESLGLKDS